MGRKKNQQRAALAAGVGAGVTKAMLGDFPKGALDFAVSGAVKNRLTGKKARSAFRPKALKAAFKSGGMSRAAGALAAAPTFPLFVSGLKDLKSDDRKRKAKGIAKITAGSALGGYLEGGVEGSWKALAKKTPKWYRSFSPLALGRGGTSLLIAPAYAAVMAKSSTGKDGRQKSTIPAAVALGTGLGAAKGFSETAIAQAKKQKGIFKPNIYKSILRTKKLWVPKTVGRAAAGAFGSAVLGGVVDRLLRKNKKKLSAVKSKYTPYPHQEAAVNKFLKSGQLILAHSTGTGKTLSAIFSFEKAKQVGKAKKALVVVPSGLRTNFVEEGIKAATDSSYQIVGSKAEAGKSAADNVHYIDSVKPVADYTVVSYDMFRKNPAGIMQGSGADTLIFDEFHAVRNEHARTHKAALEARQFAKNFIGLTASPVNNNPSEIATLVNIATNGQFMSKSLFKQRYMRSVGKKKGFWGGKKKVKALVSPGEIAHYVRPVVDLASADTLGKSMPAREVETVKVPMSPQQKQQYNYIMDQLGPIKKMIARRQVNLTPQQLQHVFGKIIHARRALNDVSSANPSMSKAQSARETPKVKKLLDDVQAHMAETSDGKAVIYSNLITGGLDVVAQGLRNRGLAYGVFAGAGREVGGKKITKRSRDHDIAQFKAGRKKIVLLSGAGAEGLDLKNATGFFSMDGHWNPERVRQAEARVRRLGGQKHRAPENRKVKIKRYTTVYPKGRLFNRNPGATVDQWIYDVASNKHQLNESMRSVLKVKTTPGTRVYKYKRKWRDLKTGEWRYEYPD